MLYYAQQMMGRGSSGGGGGGGTLDTQSVSVTQNGSLPFRERGYVTGGSLGSISDGTSDIYSGAAINKMLADEDASTFVLEIAGVQANSGWTTMTNATDSLSLTRASATFGTGGGVSTWTWTGQALSSFFATGSGTKTVNFT